MAITTERNYYQSLYELAAKVNSASTSDSVLRYIVRKVTQSLDAKGCSLMLLSADKKFLLHATAYGLSDWYLRKGPLSTDKGISEALEGTPVAVYDAVEDHRIQYREQAKKEGIDSILSIPVMLRDEVMGVMRVYTSELYHFTDDDIYFVGAAANLGAIALENVCIYESVEQEYDTFRHDMLEGHAALDNEWMFGDVIVPAEEIKESPPTPSF